MKIIEFFGMKNLTKSMSIEDFEGLHLEYFKDYTYCRIKDFLEFFLIVFYKRLVSAKKTKTYKKILNFWVNLGIIDKSTKKKCVEHLSSSPSDFCPDVLISALKNRVQTHPALNYSDISLIFQINISVKTFKSKEKTRTYNIISSKLYFYFLEIEDTIYELSHFVPGYNWLEKPNPSFFYKYYTSPSTKSNCNSCGKLTQASCLKFHFTCEICISQNSTLSCPLCKSLDFKLSTHSILTSTDNYPSLSSVSELESFLTNKHKKTLTKILIKK